MADFLPRASFRGHQNKLRGTPPWLGLRLIVVVPVMANVVVIAVVIVSLVVYLHSAGRICTGASSAFFPQSSK